MAEAYPKEIPLSQEQFDEQIKALFLVFLKQSNTNLMELLTKAFEKQKTEYGTFGQDQILTLLSRGKQIVCNTPLVDMGDRKMVMHTYLRIETNEVDSQSKTKENQ